MAINPIQVNIDNRSSFKQKKASPYLNASGAVSTDKNVKPLPPQGYLIHDNLSNSIKYFFKDIGYDFKAVKDGIKGTANDHQLGRLNDVGLKLGGIGIATYLASQTKNPKARLMEYIGLGAFLTAMNIYPKLAINGPAKIKHGFDIDKEYIDDQGRKKSVMQDSNYVPYDMYLAEIPEEDISVIGDRMGIPRDIKNRNDVIKEQMKKIATQNNTLWMLTAGFATPLMTALMCCGLENYVVGPVLEKARSAKFNKQIADLLKKTEAMQTGISELAENNLSKNVEKILSKYVGKELPKEELNNVIELLNKNLDANVSSKLKKDLTNMLSKTASSNSESIFINSETIKDAIATAQKTIGKRNSFDKNLVPTSQELESILKSFINSGEIADGATTSIKNVSTFKTALRDLLSSKIKNANLSQRESVFANKLTDEIVNSISNNLKNKKSSFVSENSITEIVNLAKIIGEFKDNQDALAKCKSFKFEYAPETVLAKSYDKFEKTLLKELNIPFKDLKKMRESGDYTKELLDKKITELCSDNTRYTKTVKKLGKIISDMEISLHGKNETESHIKNLITAIENNYNKTAIRLNKLNSESFKSTIDALVKEDIAGLERTISSKGELFDILDGILANKESAANIEKYIKYNSKGLGSSKNAEISRIFERYQGVKNSFNRILHTLDVYKRSANPETFAHNLEGKSPEYQKAIIAKAKEALLKATSSDHTLKLDTVNNASFYKDLMDAAWAVEKESAIGVKQKGYISKASKEALEGVKNSKEVGLVERFQYYISRFKNIISNSTIDFTKPKHILNGEIRNNYTAAETTRMSVFNLIGQSPVEMAKGAANRKYSTQKWVRTVSAICGAVFGLAFLAQLGFGKLNNPNNLQKQVKDE